MTTVNGISGLTKYVNQISKQAMNSGSSTKRAVIDTGKKHVQTDVYDVYTPDESNPYSYKRTGELKENWKTEPTSDGMAVYSNRYDDGRYVSEIVESGIGYSYDFEYNGVSRPFTKNTVLELQNSNKLADALKQDLRSKGFNVQ